MTSQTFTSTGVERLVNDFSLHSLERNEALAANALDCSVTAGLKTMIMVDADKTLGPQDASAIFWQKPGYADPLKQLFSSKMGYSYTAFRQAAFLYEEMADEKVFDKWSEKVSSKLTIRPEFQVLLQKVARSKSTGAVIVTCGLHRVWEHVLKREGFQVPIIGGGRISDDYVVTPETKGNLARRLREDHGLHVCAFGDSLVDMEMLKEADQAFVVVGSNRSGSMDTPLQKAIDGEGLRPRQMLLSSNSTPRLNTDKLPIIEFDDNLIDRLIKPRSLQIYDASKKRVSKLLATNTRAKSVQGPQLREAHKKVGWYLSIEYVSEILGAETFKMQSVSKKDDEGHRLFEEHKTIIVPLMRGGDPMAHGVFEAFPSAMYVQSNLPEDIDMKHIEGKRAIILVDWVINSGGSILKYVRYIRTHLSRQIRIVVVAGVAQEEVVQGKDGVAAGGKLQQGLKGLGEVTLVALRTSKNNYQGLGPTDTGHRLFNTTHLK